MSYPEQLPSRESDAGPDNRPSKEGDDWDDRQEPEDDYEEMARNGNGTF